MKNPRLGGCPEWWTVESTPARLLSSDAAASYLGLGSRWAIYRLIASGELEALKIAGKLRLDRLDLDDFIERAKATRQSGAINPGLGRIVTPRPIPCQLAQTKRRHSGTSPGTVVVRGA